MSTRFTKNRVPLPESQSLRLVQCASAVQERITRHVADTLESRGYRGVSASMLSFLGTLDCGVNYGSEIARRLNVSRQMVAKTVRELCRVGYLEQVDGPGKQKQILFTAIGEQLIADVRQVLAEMDDTLAEQIGELALAKTLDILDKLAIEPSTEQ